MLRYSEPDLMPGGAGAKPGPPEAPPAVSAYTGLQRRRSAAAGLRAAARARRRRLRRRTAGPPTLQDMLLPAERPPVPGDAVVPARAAERRDTTMSAMAFVRRVLAIGMRGDVDRDRMRIPGRELAAIARRGRTRHGRKRVPRRAREHRHAGVEFAGDDRRCRRRQRRQDDVARLACRSRGVRQAGRRRCPPTRWRRSGRPACWVPCTWRWIRRRGKPRAAGCSRAPTIGLNRSSTYPSTEQTLSSLAAVVNGGGLGQIGDIIHNFNAALSGRQDVVRDLITRLDTFVGTLYQQRDNIIATIDELNRFSQTARRASRRS